MSQEKPEIMVIGAGAAGFSAAIALAERGYHVHLVEKDSLGSGASGRNPGRMGHGFHYVDIDTAKQYLHASIQVQRKYPGFLVGQELPFDSSIRHGRYFITKNSDNSVEEIIATYEEIRREYARLISLDPRNEVFGPVENFFRILEPSDYKGVVNSEIVEMGVETAEHLFNWKAFLLFIRDKIELNPKISLYENTKVENIERGVLGGSRFVIHTYSNTAGKRIFHCDYFVNSTWQNIEYLNDKIGLKMVPDSRTNRLKTLLVVKLPDTLLQTNSMFFCMGQHCMVSNMGEGRAMMTFAQVTNLETSTGLTLSKNAERLLDEGPTEKEKNSISAEMLQGISHYIPEMANAKVEDLKFGVVQTQGKLTLNDLTNKQSTFHKRNYFGLREEQIGVISNPCIKLFYFVENGNLVADLIDEQVAATAVLEQCIVELNDLLTSKHGLSISPQMQKIIRNNLEQRFTSKTLVQTNLSETVADLEKKILISHSLKSYSFMSFNSNRQHELSANVFDVGAIIKGHNS